MCGRGLANYYDLAPYFYFMKQFIVAHKGISHWVFFLLWTCFVYLRKKRGLIEAVPYDFTPARVFLFTRDGGVR